ncbi:MAG: NAD(P)/FAD-dependent oxidoreductase [Myxococcales bacterium]|nr:NAD(P)/FAD-dependent oxidoreductase [Polyangiaceae bacterium]MDW8251806.1 NAD(P)/FAD-dependent oxidoreductase [Myxococcales bacterium]
MGELLDVIVVGAGLSGIGAACHLKRQFPHKQVALLEGRDALGGTWDLFRYPGIRSDSDMFTLGYSFEPWEEQKAIADGPSIRAYIERTAKKYGVYSKIRFRHRVKRASWSSADALWTIEVDHEGKPVTLRTRFLWVCSGYYDYERGHAPEFPGQSRFQGRLVHPQFWPADLDYAGKRVIVIGSGATAITLVPALAETAAHVIMLQRTPTYIVSLPSVDRVAVWLREHLSPQLAYSATRWKNILVSILFYQLARRAPELVKWNLRERLWKAIGSGIDIDRHFSPPYNPWDQRLCLVPDDDLFRVLREGRASVVTDHIETFTETGIRLRSGQTLDAEIIVSATGLELLFLGGIELTVDNRRIVPHDLFNYKGCMFGDVPNLAVTFGYTNASWTLKADLVAEYLCRVFARMDSLGARVCVPRARAFIQEAPFLDLTSGYILRALDRFPRQGAKHPWRLYQNYLLDILLLRVGTLEDGILELS